MKPFILLPLTAFFLLLNSCVSTESRIAGTTDSTFSTADIEKDKRLRKAFEKPTEVAFKNDRVMVVPLLQIPQIEIPRMQEERRKAGVTGQMSPAANVYNGFVCVDTLVKSAKKIDYSKQNWTVAIAVNGALRETQTEISVPMVYDAAQKASKTVTGSMTLRTCTKEKFPQVAKVQFQMREASKKPVANVEWAAPWPALR